MNQILLTNNENNKKKNSNKYNGNNSGDMKKIIIIFAVAIIVLAVAIIGVNLFKKSNKEEKTIGKPEIFLEQMGNQVKIIAKAEAGIDKIIYTWNEEEPIEKEMNERTTHEEILDLQEGQNIINATVIDVNGEQDKANGDYTIEEDTEKPKIELDDKIGNGKVKIIATDEVNYIQYITYRWNDEEEVTIEADEENQSVLEETIDVERGENTLTVTAVNGLAKSETIEKLYKGVNNPEIEVTRDENKLYMKITHDMGFEKIAFTVNEQEYVYDENFAGYDPEQKEISYKFDLVEGENTVIIHAISNETTESAEGIKNTEAIYKGKCTYTAE